MYVIKESGEKEKLKLGRLKETIRYSGASESLANKAVRMIKDMAYPGITTREILHMVMEVLREEPGVAQRYSLKRAIMLLGPTGFPFEKFIAKVLREYGYDARTGVFVRGKCVMQEVDVMALKEGKRFMIECKYHNIPGKKTDLKVVMYTYARFLDVQHSGFDQPWLITNTKCTSEAETYSRCMGIKIIGWNYPYGEGLEKMLMERNLYPITTLESINPAIKQRLLRTNVVLVGDLLRKNFLYLKIRTGLHRKLLEKLREEAKYVLSYCVKPGEQQPNPNYRMPTCLSSSSKNE
ncbi:ATPase [Candidatus Woesearchaeota archaeon]|nr:ATPase [Candidatus Woesearchaeota archaeon]